MNEVLNRLLALFRNPGNLSHQQSLRILNYFSGHMCGITNGSLD
ncbi:hypothetical protein [Cytobacillus purgationiresistens]|uniref:Uncharacterized protein n=1 Tax=Cytobacillus purgationiresistens TaxID=863449 RepID=A0ABU0ACU2_9BACI|nr:hypothetical protein [Cytobacillus purgationiresistens]MDQ0268536.1 hypothetical protein [Cytobacillus purgationiresistens]